MKHLSESLLKSITIKKVMVVLNEDATDEKVIPFETQEEAEAYAADVATRPLRPGPLADLFDVR